MSALGFSSLPLAPALQTVLDELGFASMTSIQAQAIPLLLAGRDLVGKSQTGSGKTAAFALPILHRLQLDLPKVQALVICPTRELSAQVARELRKFGRRQPGLQIAVLCGGEPAYRQRESLERGAQIVVGTPGRLLDHLQRGALDLTTLTWVVLDEADRMLDMGFGEQVNAVLASTPKTRQTVFFSATYPRSIEAMSEEYQRDPALVAVDDAKAKPAIVHQKYELNSKPRATALLELITTLQPENALVFCNLKTTVAELLTAMQKEGVAVAGLHGDLEQPERERVMARFRNQSVRVLIATDVAARGLDIEDLELVVNAELPTQSETYVHRVGRTARAGKGGLAITLVTAQDRRHLGLIEQAIGQPLAAWTRPQSAKAKPATAMSDAKMVTLYLYAGRKDKVRAGDILGALTAEGAGLKGDEVGKIEIHDHFAYVAVSRAKADLALKGLGDGKVKGKKRKVRLVSEGV